MTRILSDLDRLISLKGLEETWPAVPQEHSNSSRGLLLGSARSEDPYHHLDNVAQTHDAILGMYVDMPDQLEIGPQDNELLSPDLCDRDSGGLRSLDSSPASTLSSSLPPTPENGYHMDWVSIFSPTPEPELQLFDGSADDHTFFKQSEGLHNHDVMLTQSSASALPINTPENVDPRLTNTLCIPTLYLEDEELELLGTPEPYEPAQLPSPQSEMMTFPFSPVPLQRLLPTQSLILTSNNHISDIKFDEELISESTSISAPTRSRQMAGLQSNDPLSPVGSTDTSRYTSARVLEKRKRNATPSDIGDDEIFVGHDDDGDDDDDWKPSSSSTTHSVKRPRLKRNPAPARKAPPQRSAKRRGSTKSRASAGPKKIVCHNCGKRSFTRQHDLDRHLNTACSTLEQEKLPCKECSQRLSRFDALMRHYNGSHPHATRPTLNEVREYAEELQLKENRNFN